MRNKIRACVGYFNLKKLTTALSISLTLFTVSPAVAAGRKMAVHAKSLAEQLDRINRFQLDCLTLIKSPSEVFQTAELVAKSTDNTYSVRVRGQRISDVAATFESDSIVYNRKDGTTRSLNFGLKSSPLLKEETGEFSFVFPIAAGETASARVLVKSELDQVYILRIALDARGQLKVAELDPVLDFSTKTKFCTKPMLRLGVGAVGSTFSQNLTSMNGSLSYETVSLPSLSLSYNQPAGPKFEHLVSLKSYEMEFDTEATFGQPLKSRLFRGNYTLQQRDSKWVYQMGESALHPVIRYGLGLRTLPVAKLALADQIELESPFAVQASLGAGFNLFTERSFMLSVDLDLSYPYVFGGDVSGNLGYTAGISYGYAFTRKLFVGSSFRYMGDSYSYSRASGLDRAGDVELHSIELELSLGVLF